MTHTLDRILTALNTHHRKATMSPDQHTARQGILNYLTGRALCSAPRPVEEAEALLDAFAAEVAAVSPERPDVTSPMPDMFTTPGVAAFAAAVDAERQRQLAKWGEQHHPDGTGQHPEQIDADVARMACQQAAEGGYLDWLHILREEVAEAFAETDPGLLRTELVQCAAVIAAWLADLDSRPAA